MWTLAEERKLFMVSFPRFLAPLDKTFACLSSSPSFPAFQSALWLVKPHFLNDTCQHMSLTGCYSDPGGHSKTLLFSSTIRPGHPALKVSGIELFNCSQRRRRRRRSQQLLHLNSILSSSAENQPLFSDFWYEYRAVKTESAPEKEDGNHL